MRNKRSVDELSIEELERILAIKKREARQQQLQRMQRSGRMVATPPPAPPEPATAPAAAPPASSTLTAGTVQVPASAVLARRTAAPRFEEDVDFTPPGRSSSIWRQFLDRSLLLVEVAAVIGLVVLGVNMLLAIGTLEMETAEAQALADAQRRAVLPTMAPTPQLRISDFVLPGGHTPPTAPGGGQFNIEEVPVHLRGLVYDQVLSPIIERPPVTEETAVRIIIPKINVDQTIVQGVDWEALKLGVGQVLNGDTPTSETGNVVLAAHNDIYGEIFRRLDELEVGDQFEIHTLTRVYTYTITRQEIVEPTDIWVMDNRGRPEVTLISCYPFQVNSHRIVIFATRNEA